MPHVYTGTLTDIGLGPLVGRAPQLRVRPEREAFGPDGLISAVPVDVPLTSGGAFTITLAASSELSPPTRYVLEVGRFETSFDGSRFHGFDAWSFFAKPGGGPVAEQGEKSPYAVYRPPWPEGTPKGIYIDTAPPNEWGVRI